MARSVYSGPMSARRIETFTPLVKLACQSYLQDRIRGTLQRATRIAETREAEPEEPAEPAATAVAETPGICTTANELAACEIVSTMLSDAGVVPAERVTLRDTRTYCNILLDDNRLRIICRFRLDGATMRIGLFDGTRSDNGSMIEEQHDLADLSDIASYAPAIISRVQQMLDAAHHEA